MSRFLILLILICIRQGLHAQYVYTIKADSVKITNSCDTAELIIENHTQNVPGFLYNKGKGRTEFRRGVVKLNDTTFLIGADTLYIPRLGAKNGLSIANGYVMLGNDSGLTSAALTNTREIPLNNHNILFTGNGNVGIGTRTALTPLFVDGDATVRGVLSLESPTYNCSLRRDPNNGHLVLKSTNVVRMDYTFGSTAAYFDLANRRVGLNGITVPKALLHIGAWNTGDSGTAPLKIAAGMLLAIPENGAIEFDGTDLYLTENSKRYKLSKTLTGQLTTSFGGPSLSAFNSITTTLSVSGAQPGDVVTVSANTGAVNPPSIIISAYVTSANTVTLQAYNASNSAVTVASDTYKVRVIK